MIHHNKKINPGFGIFIGILFFILAILSVPILLTVTFEVWIIILIAVPFAIASVLFVQLNVIYYNLNRHAEKIEECTKSLMPETYIGSTFCITKIKDLYMLRYTDRYLCFIQMHGKQEYKPSWLRKEYFGPKIPSIAPILRCPIATEFHGFKIRKCEGKAGIYDSTDNCWYTGQATMFSLFFYGHTPWELYHTDIFHNLISTIMHLSKESEIDEKKQD